MQVDHEKVHKYLGITLDYTTVGQVNINMLDYTDKIIDAFNKAYQMVGSTKSSDARAIILKVNEDCKKLIPSKVWNFIIWWENIIFFTKQDRPDTCTTLSFLATRARKPENDNWAKLVHQAKYIRGTRNLPLILSANISGIL